MIFSGAGPKAIDLLTLIKNEYVKELKEKIKKSRGVENPDVSLSPGADEFIKFAQCWLKTNPPVTMVYLDEGFGLRLQRGQAVTFYPAGQPKPMFDEGIPITMPTRYPGQGPDIVGSEEIRVI